MSFTRSGIKNKRSGAQGKSLNKTPPKKQSLLCTVDITPSSNCSMIQKGSRPHVNIHAARRLEKDIENINPDSNEDTQKNDSDTSEYVDTSDEDEDIRMKRYLKERNQIKETKQQILKELGFVESAREMKESIAKKSKLLAIKRLARIKDPSLGKRQSLRILKKDPTGVDLTLVQVEKELRKPKTEFPMVAEEFEILDLKTKEMDVDEAKEIKQSVADYNDFMKSLSSMKGIPDYLCDPPKDRSLERYQDSLKSMKIIPDNVQKVVRGRIFSIAIHPSNTEIVVAAGDKYGNLGLWNTKTKDSNDGAYMFSPHTRPISCIKFSTANSNKLFMCSYDGQLRSMDLQKNVFEKAIIDDEDLQMSGFDFIEPNHTLITSSSDGSVSIVDTRMTPSDNQVHTFMAHHRAAKCVSCHPIDRHYVATSHRDSSVFIFDIRKITANNKCKPLVSINDHKRSVSSAYFSPLSGKHLLTTSYDNHIRIFDTSTISQEKVKLESSCSHNTQTGRWLSSFRAAWHPNMENVFTVGSISQPRQIQVFDSTAKQLHSFCDPEVLGTICSLSCFHGTRNILAGGNSSGKVYVFSDD